MSASVEVGLAADLRMEIRPMTKKLGLLVSLTGCLIALGAAPALAEGSNLPDETDVGAVVVQDPSGLSFTGANVSVWMILAAGLLLLRAAPRLPRRPRAARAPR